jgi:xylose isomerase domain protein TIM barrel
MKLSISNIAWDSENDKKVYELMKKYSYEGLEIAPTKIFFENPYEKLEKVEVWKKDLNDKYGFKISSMQSIWYGKKERLFGTDEERKELQNYTEKAIDFAKMIECKNLVFGSPKNRNLEENENPDKAKEFFKSIGEYAFKNNTVIGMEANPTIYNTNYINDTKSALELIKTVDSRGFLLNLDIGTVISNNENIEEILGNVEYINHVHISEPWLKIIEKREIHKKLKSILKNENYKGFVSIEMAKVERIEEVEKVMEYVREVFK